MRNLIAKIDENEKETFRDAFWNEVAAKDMDVDTMLAFYDKLSDEEVKKLMSNSSLCTFEEAVIIGLGQTEEEADNEPSVMGDMNERENAILYRLGSAVFPEED